MADEVKKPIPAKEILDKIRNGDDVNYSNENIEDDLDLSHVGLLKDENDRKIVKSQIALERCKINGKLDFSRSFFEKPISFRRSQFEGDADFVESRFEGDADFVESRFENVNFAGSQFKNAYFTGSQFEEIAGFEDSHFDGKIDFGRFMGKKTQFKGPLILDNCRINSMMIDAEFSSSEQISLKYSDLNRLFAHWDSIKGDIKYHDSTYLALVRNYNNLGWFEDADQCYYRYRRLAQSEKGDWYLTDSSKLIDEFIKNLMTGFVGLYSHLKIPIEDVSWISHQYPFKRIYWFNWSKFIDLISEVSCGYGAKVERIILWIFGSIFVFALLYNRFNVIDKTVGTNASPINSSTSFIDSLYFSTMALTGQIPANVQVHGSWTYVATIERLLGYLFLALFVVVLARKLIRH